MATASSSPTLEGMTSTGASLTFTTSAKVRFLSAALQG